MTTELLLPPEARATAVLYLRVSTPSQVNTDYDPEGISIPAQREACLRKAAQLGLTVVETYIEPGKSATSMDKRPAFQAMLERIRRQRDVGYVIVYKLSRMNRNRLDDALVIAELRKYRATLISATESIDETPVGQLMHGILASFNEYRSAEDGADIKYKMGEKAKKGGTLGRAPLGYLNHRERFEGREVRMVVLDPERAPFVRLAFELYDTGRFTLQGLSDELYDRGLRSRPGRFPAGAVTDSKLCTLLRDRYYLGVVKYKGAEYPGRHEALVNQELFDRVQVRIESTGVSGERRITHDQYLKGTVWCARCHERGVKRRLIVNRVAGKGDTEYFYYFCRGRQDASCNLPYIPIFVLEEEIARFWGTQGLSESFIQRVRDRIQATLDEEQASAQLMRQQISTELAAVDRQEENLLDLAAGGTLAAEKIQTRLTRLAAERKRLQGRLGEDGEQLRQGGLVLARQLELLFHPEKLYRQLDDLGRRLLNQAVFEELLIDVDETEPRVTGATYTEPVRGLMQAHEDYRSGSLVSPQVTDDRRPTVSGGPSERTLTGLLRIPHVEDWSKTVMVEVLRRYSNRSDLVKIMVDVLRRIEEGDRTDEPGVLSSGRGGGSSPIGKRLGDEDIAELVACFKSGTTIRELAGRYGVAPVTVKRILRRCGVSRRRAHVA